MAQKSIRSFFAPKSKPSKQENEEDLVQKDTKKSEEKVDKRTKKRKSGAEEGSERSKRIKREEDVDKEGKEDFDDKGVEDKGEDLDNKKDKNNTEKKDLNKEKKGSGGIKQKKDTESKQEEDQEKEEEEIDQDKDTKSVEEEEQDKDTKSVEEEDQEKDTKEEEEIDQDKDTKSKQEIGEEEEDDWRAGGRSRKRVFESDEDEDADGKQKDHQSTEPPMDTSTITSSSASKNKTKIPLRKTALKPKKKNLTKEIALKETKKEKMADNKNTKNVEKIDQEMEMSDGKSEVEEGNNDKGENKGKEGDGVDKEKDDKKNIENKNDRKDGKKDNKLDVKDEKRDDRKVDGKTGVKDEKGDDRKADGKTGVKDEKGDDRKADGKKDEDLSFDPSVHHYNPIKHACWSKGEKVPFIALARTFEIIETVSSRLKTAEILSNLFRSIIILTPSELSPVVHLCLNRLGPSYEGLELGVGENILMKTVAQATGRSMDRIKADVQEKGDLGLVAESSRSTQKTMFKASKLTVLQVFNKLKLVAAMTGHSSTSKKTDSIKHLFVSCRGSEARYLIRSLAGKLRIGLAEQTLLIAVSQAMVMHTAQENGEKAPTGEVLKKKIDEATTIIKTAYCECPNFDLIIPAILDHPLNQLHLHCKLTPGIPLKPMLAHPTKGVHEVMSRFEGCEFVCEFKYDGERAQIHIIEGGKQVEIFSRNQENNTSKYPDLITTVKEVVNKDSKVESAILDAEVVAWDEEKKQILPFQVLSTRKKKDAKVDSIKVKICVFVFDLLYLNGRSLVGEALRQRRSQLKENFGQIEGRFTFATYLESACTDEIGVFLEDSIKGDCEGLMIKSLDKDGTYQIAKRSHNWLKLKKDYLDGVGDTVDLVVMGGYHGSGKRAGKFGGFLLGCYDDENEEFQSICKIGTGFTDADLEEHSTYFKEHTIPKAKSYYRHDPSQCPDKWFETKQVWEVKAADLSISPIYKAALGLVDSTKGISLRFPRFLRIREDKKVEEATTSCQIAQLYKSQDQIVNQMKNKKEEEEEDDY